MFVRPFINQGGAVYKPTSYEINVSNYFKRSGTGKGFGADSQKLTMVHWFKQTVTNGASGWLYRDEPNVSLAEFGLQMTGWVAGGGSAAGHNLIKFVFGNGTYRMISTGWTTHGVNGNWVCVLASLDYSAAGVPPTGKMWFCGPGFADVNVAWGSTSTFNGAYTLNLDYETHIADNYPSGGTVRLSDATWHQGVALDFNTESERRKFVTATGKPVDPGLNGSGCWGFQPYNYFLNGDFRNNIGSGSANAWIFQGTPTANADGPSN